MKRRHADRSRTGRIVQLIVALSAGLAAGKSLAEDWGAYALVPVSAQALVLEAVGSGASEGTVVAIGKPAGTANQKWIITAKGDNFYSIRPSYSSGARAGRGQRRRETRHPHRARSRPRAGTGSTGPSGSTKMGL